jgi:hypothetical protein
MEKSTGFATFTNLVKVGVFTVRLTVTGDSSKKALLD